MNLYFYFIKNKFIADEKVNLISTVFMLRIKVIIRYVMFRFITKNDTAQLIGHYSEKKTKYLSLSFHSDK